MRIRKIGKPEGFFLSPNAANRLYDFPLTPKKTRRSATWEIPWNTNRLQLKRSCSSVPRSQALYCGHSCSALCAPISSWKWNCRNFITGNLPISNWQVSENKIAKFLPIWAEIVDIYLLALVVCSTKDKYSWIMLRSIAHPISKWLPEIRICEAQKNHGI